MPDMIPAAKIAAAALHQVKAASGCAPTSYHDTDKIKQQQIHLQVAEELLALIAGPQPMVIVAGDGTMAQVARYGTVSGDGSGEPLDEINF